MTELATALFIATASSVIIIEVFPFAVEWVKNQIQTATDDYSTTLKPPYV